MTQITRKWDAARNKAERGCRICGAPAEAAHIVGREHDRYFALCETNPLRWPSDRVERPTKTWHVAPERICPLCPDHHKAYDKHELDLLPHLSLGEQMQAVLDAGSLENARIRTAPLAYKNKVPMTWVAAE